MILSISSQQLSQADGNTYERHESVVTLTLVSGPRTQHYRHKMWDKTSLPLSPHKYLRRMLASIIAVSHWPALSCREHSESHHRFILSVKLLSIHEDNNTIIDTDSKQLFLLCITSQPSHSQTDFLLLSAPHPPQPKGRVCLRSQAAEPVPNIMQEACS